ncbi:MAG: putative rane-bound ClpP-class protease [Labilithrix sp.]|nr:putative rane-bound ClpP-class protease [Labilithrix sp.]
MSGAFECDPVRRAARGVSILELDVRRARNGFRTSCFVARLRWLAAALAFVLVLVLPSARADAPLAPEARLLTARGQIDPVTARYLEREIERADVDGADLVVVELDTPGGLDASMREIVQTLLGSRVPVVVHVAPAGARAASAGMFVTLAASVAAMAPGTAIGAAHPVTIGRAKADPAMADKVVNDAAAFARAIAATRHRNADWPERAVRESVSLTSDEALRERVIDLVASDVPDLLRQLDGRSVPTASGDRPLHTAGLHVDARPMLVSERIVQIVSDPNVAYLLFLLGLLGIAAELYHPGTFVPGTLGAIALVLALVAFGNLPISWAGIVLILLAIGPAAPGPTVRVSPALVIVMSATVAAFFLLVVRATLRARHLAVRTGIPVLVGHVGVATSELAPAGTVRVDSEVWSAEAEGEPIHAGERVIVVGGAGVTLRVTRSQGEATWNRSSATSS